ncbi:MAG: hypothetical protein H7A37_01580 [Chlamydiales bacterium]|nr:hypothetical protein [Chlamydiia bacterium]MCP5506983.1 hypothetical protein [Chlamydiales bacterium]
MGRIGHDHHDAEPFLAISGNALISFGVSEAARYHGYTVTTAPVLVGILVDHLLEDMFDSATLSSRIQKPLPRIKKFVLPLGIGVLVGAVASGRSDMAEGAAATILGCLASRIGFFVCNRLGIFNPAIRIIEWK